ncbi:hypothetical protein M2354_002002 [Leclercia adecarboxylata]|uniref:phage tail fiber protein n=1 Tax=Leclercia adecarboxylata TaxID=83655 RepID=UPI002474E26C|nr:hypothetical protein [Leclercia adecarboxylata]MDH6162347.1 hypothetical protein [Leclercia adecarboxylata]
MAMRKDSITLTMAEISDLTKPLSLTQGGTGATTAANARKNIEAARGGSTISGGYSTIISVDPGIYSISGGNFSDGNNGDFGSLFSSGVYGSNLNGQIFIRNDGTALLFRGGSDSTVRKVYTDVNTTRDSNGFLKVASPVVQVFSDGSYETNDESEGVTVTRQAVGVYLLEGCVGLNADAAWGGPDGGFEIPLDRNKQARIWLDYEVNADGSILVKTYHRTHPDAPAFARNEREGYAQGDPIDIPADQFVSVRVEMPVDSIWNQRQLEAAAAMAETVPEEQPDVQQ